MPESPLSPAAHGRSALLPHRKLQALECQQHQLPVGVLYTQSQLIYTLDDVKS